MIKDALRDALDRFGGLALAERTARLVREHATAWGRGQREHREALTRFYAAFMGPGDVVFDVGAHVGGRTEVFLALGASVIAFEPQEACARRLYRHFGSNPRVAIVQRALDAEAGEKIMYGSATSPVGSLSTEWRAAVQASGRFGAGEFQRQEVVRTTTLDAVIAVYGLPRFCKVDVEGFEYQVVRGLSKAIPALSLEFTPETIGSTIQCLEHLDRLASYEYNFSSGESLSFDFASWQPRDAFVPSLERAVREFGSPSTFYGDVYARVRG